MNSRRIVIALATAVCSLLVVNAAWGCGLQVTATAACNPNTGQLAINYTATSWILGPGGANPDIRILVNNVQQDSGAFTAPDYSFSGTVPVPAGVASGDTVIVTALAAGTWENGEAGGQSWSVSVVIPDITTDPACFQPGLGRFTGGGQQIRVGTARFNKGLTVHCDLLLSNNLEVNWAGGNNFHMLEHMMTVACTDSPDIIQAPPVAPLDTLTGWGIGRFNTEPDVYSIVFTLVDAGEPGTNDKAAILIYKGDFYTLTPDPATIVLNVPLSFVDSGNLQAHYDQPHK